MKKLYILPLLLTLCACGPGILRLDNHQVQGKSAFYDDPNHGSFPFSEQTFGGSLLQSTANWACSSPACPNTGLQPVTAENAKQAAVKVASPNAKILANVKDALSNKLRWASVAKSNADFSVHLSHNWGIRHHIVKVTQYKIFYDGTLRITSNHILKGKDSAQSNYFSCQYETDSKYSYDEVYSNNASAVKTAMSEAASECSKQLINKINDTIASDSAKN